MEPIGFPESRLYFSKLYFSKLYYSELYFSKCTRLMHLLSFASLFLFIFCLFVWHHSIKTSSFFFSKNDEMVDTPKYFCNEYSHLLGVFQLGILWSKKLKLLFFCLLSGRRRVGNSVIISGLPAPVEEVYPSPPHLLPWLLGNLCKHLCQFVTAASFDFPNFDQLSCLVWMLLLNEASLFLTGPILSLALLLHWGKYFGQVSKT